MTASRSHAAPDPHQAAELIEAYYQRGYSDGFPVVPPSARSVAAMLAAQGLAGDAVLGELRLHNRVLTADKVAINAVLAGCLPEYMPVVVAAAKALCHPDFGFHPVMADTGGNAVAVIVNGPYARAIGVNARDNALGHGVRANATIGRAVRLIIVNALGYRPGELDRGTIGYPGRYSFCFAENEADSPWAPLHVERGFAPEQSTVTLLAVQSVLQVHNSMAATPEPLLRTVGESMAFLGSQNLHGQPEAAVVFAAQHCAVLRASGWDKAAVKQCIFRHARRSLADLKAVQRHPGEPAPGDEARWVHAVRDPEEILVLCAGGAGGAYAAVLGGGQSHTNTRSVTVPVEVP